MLENMNHKPFTYVKLTQEEMADRKILGRLVGIISDYKHPTRNDRLYSEELWDKTFDNPIMKEKIEHRCIFGELGHPADRLEIDMEKIAICLAELPKKADDGCLHGVFDILDTPNGRILKTMCDYGCDIGVSSRGNGDTYTNMNGQEEVDPDTFQCECWDAVLLPAVKAARMTYVNESLNGKTLKQALNEELSNETPESRRIIEETLKKLDIEYDSKLAVNDVKANGMVKQLQESLKQNQELESQITALQEKLSVCYMKEAKYEEDIVKYKNTIRRLSESASEVKTLKEEVSTLKSEITSKSSLLQESQSQSRALLTERKTVDKQKVELTETLSRRESEISKLNSQVRSLTESLNKARNEKVEVSKSLNEDIENIKKDLAIKQNEYSNKLAKSNRLIEQYRNTAKLAVNKYIQSQAVMLGITPEEIKNKLPENYSFDDISNVCESLKDFSLKINTLPFDVSKKATKVTLKEDKSKYVTPDSASASMYDDDIDPSLLALIEATQK